jgi:hypothetical protein
MQDLFTLYLLAVRLQETQDVGLSLHVKHGRMQFNELFIQIYYVPF